MKSIAPRGALRRQREDAVLELLHNTPLMAAGPRPRLQVRMYNKLIDEYGHNSCTILAFAARFRHNSPNRPREVSLAEINKAPPKRRPEYKRSVIEPVLDHAALVF